MMNFILFQAIDEADPENDITGNILGFYNIVTSFKELGDLVASVADCAENE